MNIYDNDTFFQAYASMPRSIDGLRSAAEWSILNPLFPDLKDKTMLDLGCGYGWHCAYAAACGAKKIVGIDASEKMLQEAYKRNAHPNITYHHQSITDYDYPEDTYDFVLSNLVLHYIEHLDDIFHKVHRTLKKDGTFLFNIEHPVFTSGINQQWITDSSNQPLYWPVDNYYYPGKRITNFLNQPVVKYHHTMTQILQGLLNAGFEITAFHEVEPPEFLLKDPDMHNEMRRPMMLIIKVRKKCAFSKRV